MANKKPAAKKKAAPAEPITDGLPVQVETVETVKPVPTKPVEPAKPEWEIKDRVYFLKNDAAPLTHTIPGKHTPKHSLLYFDEETGVQKEIRYATNHASPFKQDQKGEATLGHIVFREGILTVPKQKQNLQKLLSLYHPLRNRIFEEYDSVEEAEDDIDVLDMQVDAAIIARDI